MAINYSGDVKQNRLAYLFLCLLLILGLQGCGQKEDANSIGKTSPVATTNQLETVNPPKSNVDYDARQFLSRIDIIGFNHKFPDFDEKPVAKNWEWKDVDPLGLYTPDQNRQTRRDIFLFEITPQNLQDNAGTPNSDQIAFKQVLEKESPSIQVLLTAHTAKILAPFTMSYETNDASFRQNLLMKTASWGLRWSQVGGMNLYIYNGNVLISRFKDGYVSLPLSDIDHPFNKENSIK